MREIRFASLALLLLAGCAAPKLPPPIDNSPQHADAGAVERFPVQIRVERPGMTCRGVTRATKRALKRMGYVIESVSAPSPGVTGEIRARRNTGSYIGDPGDAYGVAARLSCNDQGAAVEAATEEPFSERLAFRRDFPVELNRAVERKVRRPAAKPSQPAAKLHLYLQPLQGSAAAEVIGGAPETLGITPVRVQIRNRTEFVYRLEVGRFKLISEEGASNRPLSVHQVAAKVAPEWRAKVRSQQIPDATIKPGATIDGYVFVPAAAYRRAKLILIEADSEEAEGFSVEF